MAIHRHPAFLCSENCNRVYFKKLPQQRELPIEHLIF